MVWTCRPTQEDMRVVEVTEQLSRMQKIGPNEDGKSAVATFDGSRDGGSRNKKKVCMMR